MNSTANLLWGLFFSSLGIGYFIYGKKQQRVVPLFVGLGLMLYPYFITNTVLLVVIGLALMAAAYFLRY